MTYKYFKDEAWPSSFGISPDNWLLIISLLKIMYYIKCKK